MTDTTVADDAKAAAAAASEDGGAQAEQDEVERILAEYRQGQSSEPATPEPKQTAEPDSDVAKLRQELNELKQERSRQHTRQGINEAVAVIKGDLGIPGEFVEGRLEAEASRDPGFLNAFMDRDRNPDKWQQILKGKAAQWKRELGQLPSPELTADREAIRAAASSATDAPRKADAPSGKELAGMSPEDRAEDYAKWLSGG